MGLGFFQDSYPIVSILCECLLSYNQILQFRSFDNSPSIRITDQNFRRYPNLIPSFYISHLSQFTDLDFFCTTNGISVLLWILKKYHVFAPMGRFQLESIYLYFTPSSQLLYICFCPVGLPLPQQHYQQVLWVLKSLRSPGLGRSDFNTHKTC